jgi:uncharacterized membrane protein
MTISEREGLPTHVEEAIQAMAAMHAAHHQQASVAERLIDRMTATVARPNFLIFVALALVIWVAANFLAPLVGLTHVDRWPFPLLSLLVSCTALFIAVLILASQTRADRLANL